MKIIYFLIYCYVFSFIIIHIIITILFWRLMFSLLSIRQKSAKVNNNAITDNDNSNKEKKQKRHILFLLEFTLNSFDLQRYGNDDDIMKRMIITIK